MSLAPSDLETKEVLGLTTDLPLYMLREEMIVTTKEADVGAWLRRS